jgi:hypothetical protein
MWCSLLFSARTTLLGVFVFLGVLATQSAAAAAAFDEDLSDAGNTKNELRYVLWMLSTK